MSTFADQHWNSRVGTLGDIAEQEFEARIGRGYVRSGLNRPPLAVHQLPLVERYRPDYLCSNAYYEVQGCGRDGKLKFKTEKLAALSIWDGHHPVRLWLWDSHRKRWADIDLKTMYTLIASDGVAGTFKEGNPYWAVPVAAIDPWNEA